MPERYLYDFLSDFTAGINSDAAIITLPKNVASFAINSTMRGGFVRPRPPLFLRTLVFPSDDVQLTVETGFFQGAGFYRPDFGPSQLVAQINGRLFTFTQNEVGFAVAEITIPGDANDPTTNQTWMWQAEKWLIITDGTTKFPIFYDGTTTRRSYGPSRVLAVGTGAVPGTPPPINGTVQITTLDPYTGPINVPVLFNGEYYQVISIASTTEGDTQVANYNVTLTNMDAPAGDTVATGTPVTANPVREPLAATPIGAPFGTFGIIYPSNNILLTFSKKHYYAVGDFLEMTGEVTVYSNRTLPSILAVYSGPITVIVTEIVNATQVRVKIHQAGPSLWWEVQGVYAVQFADYSVGYRGALILSPIQSTPGTTVQLQNVPPTVSFGNTLAPFVIPAVGQSVTITLSLPYSGEPGAFAYVNGFQYTIIPGVPQPAGPPVPVNLVLLLNLTDTDTAAYSFPADQNILTVPELPAGRMGAYGLGHVAMSLVDGISFIYGDAVGGPSGTQANNYRDSVLTTTENDFMVGGGSFRIPNSGEIITSMTFTAVLDAAFGQGPLLLGTPTSIYSCDVPTDRALWVALTNPVLTQVLIGKGPLAQNSTIAANSDTLFRSSDGIGSLIFGRRDFETWGNTPISSEMDRTVRRDILSLLSYGSAVTFDNRFLSTAAPQVSNQGVFHIGTLVMNFDPVSSLRGKAPSIWESLWVGTNVLQYVVGRFGAEERCFQFTFNQRTNKIELYEVLRSDSVEIFDHGTERIGWMVETPCIYKPSERPDTMPIVRLTNGKIHLSEIVGTVHVKVSWRPDFYPLWTVWHETEVCAEVTLAEPTSQRGYRTVGLGEPPIAPCEATNNRVLRSGRFHQIRIDLLGQCVVNGMEFAAVPEPTIIFPSPDCCVIPEDNIQ